jgi:phosphate transport system permease protein
MNAGKKISVAPYTRTVRRKQTIAKVVLWITAGVTIGILVVIIGYILFRGFISDVRTENPVIAKGQQTVSLDWQGNDQIVFLAHRKIRIRDLTIRDIIELFSGESRDWAVTEQDIDARVFTYRETDELGSLFFQRYIEPSEKEEYARRTTYVRSEEEMIGKVAETPGGIGYIRAENRELLEGRRVQLIPVRQISLIVNPEVLEIKDNLKLRFLTADQSKQVFGGQVDNWLQVKGVDLPVTVVSFFPKMHLGEEFQKLMGGQAGTISSRAVFVRSPEQMYETLRNTPGAVGYCYYADALSYNPELILGVERRVIKQNLKLSFIIEPPKKAGRVGGISTIIINTVMMIALTLLFSTPIGVGAALYLNEYARQGRLLQILRYSTETLAAIPSIIFGIFGYILFVNIMKLGIGLLSGTLTVTIMILPTIIRTSEEAFKTVPMSYREGSLALGATKWQTMTGVVVPAAAPGILTGVILGIGRAVGETAAILFTMGSSYGLARSLSDSARVLSLHLYILAREGISFERAFATGAILIFIVLIVNYTTTRLIGRMNRLKG